MSEFKNQIAELMQQQAAQTSPQVETKVEVQPQVEVPTQAQTVQTPTQVTAEATQPLNPTAATAQTPTITEEAFLGWLQEKTGGKVKDLNFVSQLDEIEQLRQKTTALETQSKISPYANPLVEKLNQLYSMGADNTQIQNFLNAQTLNLEALSDKEAYAEYLVRSISGITKSDAMEAFDAKYGTDDLTPLEKIEKAKEIAAAKNFLKEQKVAAENPEAIRQKALQAENFERQKAEWQRQVRTLATQTAKVGGSYRDGENEHSFGVNITPQELESLMPFVTDAVANQPLNQDSLNMAKNILEGYWIMANKDRFMQTIHRDGYAKGEEAATKRLAGVPPQVPTEGGGQAPLSDIDKLVQSNPNLQKLLM